jgi:DNA repair protein RadC
LLLDGACRLIADEKHAVGTNDFVPIVVREVARVALQWNAAAVIMTHNHPYNTKQASKQDKMQIKDLGSRLRGIGIALVDSIIITDKECISMRSGAEIDNLNVDDYGIRAILDSTAWFDAY